MIVVSDTSPIRCLLAIDKADLLQKLFNEVIIPPAVETELRRVAFLKNKVEDFLNNSWVILKPLEYNTDYLAVRRLLDEGESEAIVLALQIKADLLLMDENKGRNIAKAKGLKPLGLIGVLLRAKKLNLIPLIKPLLDELISNHGFWIENSFYADVLIVAGE